ncbi:hypothetical protein [Acidiphilium sp.]|uniref:hypothetical protein n=1 Tax=Acidiphilium sp. TaxID=527 RepID=UPI00258A7103|nr:hypothetical protein [Acidiphilium sp.]
MADILIDGSNGEFGKIASIIRTGFFRSVHVSSALDKSLTDRLSVAVMAAGATMTVVERLWQGAILPWQGHKIRRGGLSGVAHDLCRYFSEWRTLWRTNGAAAVLEWPVGGQPWLRPLHLAEIDVMIDQIGVEADNSAGEAGYLLHRLAHAVMARLSSWLPPASVVEWAGPNNQPGYAARAETISLVQPTG